MPVWVWAILIVIAALVICVGIYIYTKRKAIYNNLKSKLSLKHFSKEERSKRKAEKQARKQPATPIEAKEKEPEISFEEKEIIVDEEKPDVQFEGYLPSSEFIERPAYVQEDRPTLRRRFPNSRFEQANWNRQRTIQQQQKLPIKEQIKNLSPEMKAIIFANVLDSRLDDSDKF